MDAANLAMMVTPNLLKGSNPVRDIMMTSVPTATITGMSAGKAVSTFVPDGSGQSGTSEGKTSLGMVIAFCIRRYYEVFDEVVDRSEAVAPWKSMERPASVTGEDASGTYVLGEDEDLDDELSERASNTYAGPSSSRISAAFKRHRQKNSVESNQSGLARSVHAAEGATCSSPSAWNTRFPANVFSSNGKARSVSVEKNGSSPIGNASFRRGSITIGKGATRKGSGAAVEAVGITASGFFAPPGGGPPSVPVLPTSPSSRKVEPEEEDQSLSVADRKKLFEAGVV